MRQLVFMFFFLMITVTSQTVGATEQLTELFRILPVGTILPKHATPEVFSKAPTPISIRIVNRAKYPVYLQGFRRDKSKTVHFFFYHREKGFGWKHFFESLPCNHPSCRNLNALSRPCEKSEPYVIRLGPAGSAESVKAFVWKGLLYQKVEATMENLERQFCYKGKSPSSGRIRIEIEYSDTVRRGRDGYWEIGGRDHTAIEFNLPATQKVYEISVGE